MDLGQCGCVADILDLQSECLDLGVTSCPLVTSTDPSLPATAEKNFPSCLPHWVVVSRKDLELGTVVHTCDPRTLEAKAGGAYKIEVSLGYTSSSELV